MTSTAPDAAFAYQRLAMDVTALVDSGTLRPGERLPSIRQMSARQRVSIPTVLQAYQLLEARRVVAARPRSGYYVLPRHAGAANRTGPEVLADPTAITSADLIVRLLDVIANPELLPLGTALPDPSLLPCAALGRMMGRAMRRNSQRSATLFTSTGAPELRRQIARRVMDAGDRATPEDIIVTAGASEAVSLCLRATGRAGQAVAVESPCWFGTLQAIHALGMRAIEIPTDSSTGMVLEVLETALARGGVAAVVVNPTVHNPLGYVMPLSRKRQLISITARHECPIIEDETYAELYHGTARPPSLRSFDEDGLVLSCGSFSKTLAPGYRVGWTLPGKFREAVLHHKLATTVSVAVPPQLAIAEFLASGAYDRHLNGLRGVFGQNVQRWSEQLLTIFPEGTSVSRPAGGFLLWVQLPDGFDTVELQRRAVHYSLSIAPGPAFSASGQYSTCLRVNAGYEWSDRISSALEQCASLGNLA